MMYSFLRHRIQHFIFHSFGITCFIFLANQNVFPQTTTAKVISPETLQNALNNTFQSGLALEQIESYIENHISQNQNPRELFQTQILPILKSNCLSCHGESVQQSNLRLDSVSKILIGGDFGPSVVPGDSENSLLIEAVQYEHELKMPPQGKMNEEDIQTLIRWVENKPYWEQENAVNPAAIFEHIPWSFQEIKAPEIPVIDDPDWVRNPIDTFILSKLQENGLSHSNEADKRTLLRRLKLTLHGLPPTLEEQDTFLRDESPDAYEKLVDRLLDSPRYGERWGQHWMDVTSFGETHGFETNTPRENAWKYRDYVIESFNEDKPYNDFIIEQIAGDSMYKDVATGFLVSAPALLDGSGIGKDLQGILQARQDELNGIINVVSSSMLGVTVACARCHNHKFDPITQQDYYAIQAVFAGVKHGERINKPEDYDERMKVADDLRSVVKRINSKLNSLKHPANPDTYFLDDQGPLIDSIHQGYVSYLSKPDSVKEITKGTEQGQTFDYGGTHRLPTLSSSATVWKSDPNSNLMSYHPKLNGEYWIWVSWLCGIEDLANDAQYVLDHDGDIHTDHDQTIIATINQNQMADGTTLQIDSAEKPLWSGFQSTGKFELNPNSIIVLRSGNSAKRISADKIAFQRSVENYPHPIIRPSLNTGRNIEMFPPTTAKFIRFSAYQTNRNGEPCIDEIEVYGLVSPDYNLALASNGAKATASPSWDSNIHKIKHINDGKLGNSFSWIPNEKRSWIQLELPEENEIHKIVWGRDQTGQLNDRLATSYKIEVSLDEKRWKTVTSSDDRFPFRMEHHMSDIQSVVGRNVEEKTYLSWREKIQATYKKIFEVTDFGKVYAGVFTKPHEVHRLYRGDPMQKKEIVKPNALQVIRGLSGINNESTDQERRLAFAQWIASKDNPLTPRVMVNRLWYYHFGEGIVNTPSDFGANGGKPTHPELLDWMALEFMRNGWSMKEMHRLIVTSSTYRQDSGPNTEALKIDSQNRLLWRFAPRRLEAEPIRDSVLAISGKLRLEMGGPGFNVFKDNNNYVRVYDPKEEWGPDEFRRMVYATKVRMEKDATFGAFDCPDLGQTAPKRPRSTTPMQALNLFNSGFINEQASFFAERLEKHDPTTAGQVNMSYQLAYSRKPDHDELKRSKQFIDDYGLQAFCRAVLNSNELLFIQ